MNPYEDGVTHVNVYSKGLTPLGRMLSNFYRYEIHTKDGSFMSVEAYYYWLGIDCDADEKSHLRMMDGYKAKAEGQRLKQFYGEVIDLEFEDKIVRAIWYKAQRHLHLYNPFYKNLPFEHYYNYKGNIVDVKHKCDWIIDAITRMSKYIYENKETLIK